MGRGHTHRTPCRAAVDVPLVHRDTQPMRPHLAGAVGEEVDARLSPRRLANHSGAKALNAAVHFLQ
eukprot:1080276-Prorocentrum_minimum.AAC.1